MRSSLVTTLFTALLPLGTALAVATCGGDATSSTASANSGGAGSQIGSGASGPGSGGTAGDGSGATGPGSGGDGAGGTGSGGAGGSGGMVCNEGPGTTCTSAADCRQFASFCDDAPCACLPLAQGDPDPTCGGMPVACFDDPCLGKMPACVDGRCTINGGAMGESCLSDDNCAGGLKCCYPCGIMGCFNQCTTPDTNCQCFAVP